MLNRNKKKTLGEWEKAKEKMIKIPALRKLSEVERENIFVIKGATGRKNVWLQDRAGKALRDFKIALANKDVGNRISNPQKERMISNLIVDFNFQRETIEKYIKKFATGPEKKMWLKDLEASESYLKMIGHR